LFPGCARGNTFVGSTEGFVVNPAANQAHPSFVHSVISSGLKAYCRTEGVA
jgi:hypothetical protein